jgi:tricorn protease
LDSFKQNSLKTIFALIAMLFLGITIVRSQGTRLLRQPDISTSQMTFAYGSDIWVSSINGGEAKRITSTQAVESNPYFSPDGKLIAFSSNRSGYQAVYVVASEGGEAKQVTWHPSGSLVRGWSTDGKRILYASSRETAPSPYNRLWTTGITENVPSLVHSQWGFDGAFAPDGEHLIIDRVSRWDSEWRAYRGGQNTPLIILNTTTSKEELLPNESTTDIQPLWLGDVVYFLSDRDLVSNIWSYHTKTKVLEQITSFKGSDIKWLAGHDNTLAYEREGYLHLLDLNTRASKQTQITVIGDFPWAATQWEDVSSSVRTASLSPNGKRIIAASRGDIFTVPLEFGDSRNITETTNAADRAPIWSPKGDKLAWFSDIDGKGYALMLASQDGMDTPTSIAIGESKMAWNPSWSPDGKYIAFVDDDVRLRVLNLDTKAIRTIDIGGTNIERGSIQMNWSPDSNWIAYAKAGSNNFRQIFIWSVKNGQKRAITDAFADSFSPAWDLNHKQFYFLASTEVALGSGWANTSSMSSSPSYAAYVVNLQQDDPSPFKPKSDEETPVKEKEKTKEPNKKKDKKGTDEEAPKKVVKIDFDKLSRRTLALPIPERAYNFIAPGPEGAVFIGENVPNERGLALKKFTLEDQKSKDFLSGVRNVSITGNGAHLLANLNGQWKVIDTKGDSGESGKTVNVDLQLKLDRSMEWKQMFEEAWRYERDYFYDPNLHGRDWNVVYERYAPLVPFIKHRADLTYVLDQVNGELSVGHSFVFGGDYPKVADSKMGMLGADMSVENNRWKINRRYTTESWNPGLSGPLDAPGINIKDGYYVVGVNGNELTGSDNLHKYLDGTLDKQTILHINSKPNFEGAWQEIVKPIRSENSLRQRTWVEDNRRLVDSLSNGRLGYVWVPNTSGRGYVSFNRYYFAQQDKEGAVIDERFNGGGLLDDYMVDLMTRSLRAGLTNEVPNGKPMRLPAGILGPKVLLINEMAGSGGDFFPWVFRQQKAGKLIGTTTWGGLVKSSVHYGLVDGGALTSPDNAVFDPINNKWIAENVGIAPDIEVRQDALSLSNGNDPQLERGVQELLKQLGSKTKIIPPKFPSPATGNQGN